MSNAYRPTKVKVTNGGYIFEFCVWADATYYIAHHPGAELVTPSDFRPVECIAGCLRCRRTGRVGLR